MTEYYNGEEVVEFVSKCPVDGCSNQNDCHWRHVGCHLKEYINANGEIICTDCGLKNNFFNWSFNCGHHENFKPPSRDSQRLIAAFAIMGRLANGGGKAFLSKLMNSLIQKCDT